MLVEVLQAVGVVPILEGLVGTPAAQIHRLHQRLATVIHPGIRAVCGRAECLILLVPESAAGSARAVRQLHLMVFSVFVPVLRLGCGSCP